jgi:hypothetical protein
MGHEDKVLAVMRDALERVNVVVMRTQPHEDYHLALHFYRVTGRLVVDDLKDNLARSVPPGKHKHLC